MSGWLSEIEDLAADNEFVPILGDDRRCVEYQLHNPVNAATLKRFIQLAMNLQSERQRANSVKGG